MQMLMSHIRAAAQRYNMIEAGDKIAVGVSGGKDSLALLYALSEMRRFYPKPYSIVAITLDMQFGGKPADWSKIQALCDQLGVEYIVRPTQLAKVIFEDRKEKNPCSLCARMRRGALHTHAKELGCNKIALGHHFDDAVETFMMNLFNEGRIGCFSPVTYLDRMDITVLRPLVYVPEKDIRYFINHSDLPILKSPCPADKSTDREEIKQLLCKLDKENKGIKYRIFGAMQRAGVDGFKTVDGDALKEI